MKKLIVLLFSFLFILGCGDDEPVNNVPTPEEVFTVSGMISLNNMPVDEADVTLTRTSSNTIYNTQTDASGEFAIEVLAGLYNITISKAFSDGSFVEKSYEASISENTTTENINLPEPVTLSEPTETTVDGFTMNWSESTSDDFAEYQLYVHTTADVNTNTGTLLYTGASITDTSFEVTENLVPTETYYYIVFVVNTDGEVAGSNVVEITVQDANAVENGDFEDPIMDPPNGWVFQPTQGAISTGDGVSVVDDESYSGNQSLRMTPNTDWDPNAYIVETGVVNEMPMNLFVPGARYKISFYMKYNVTGDMYPNNFSFSFFGDGYTNITAAVTGQGTLNSFPNNGTWEYYEREVLLTNTLEPDSCFLTFEIYSDADKLGFDFWIDDVEIVRID